MMMFGEYSQRYYKKANWGKKWRIDILAPIIYYATGIFAILLVVILLIQLVGLLRTVFY